MLHLHLLRHAKTEQFSTTGRDFDRALMERGKKQAKELKLYFNSIRNIGCVWCSTAKRTRQTLDALEGLPEPAYMDALYLCSSRDMLELLWRNDTIDDVLIVGHNFGISDLVNYFCGTAIELRTGEYVKIAFECNDWKEVFADTGVIVDRYRPDC